VLVGRLREALHILHAIIVSSVPLMPFGSSATAHSRV
jgi:hypothetical protein